MKTAILLAFGLLVLLEPFVPCAQASSPAENLGIFISNGVNVPDSAGFPMKERYFSFVGPRVRLTAAHVFTGGQPCPEDSPAWKGKPIEDPDTHRIWLLGPGACKYLAADFDWPDLKKSPLPAGVGHDDWALVIEPEPVNSTAYLSLDFAPIQKGEKLVIIGKGKTNVLGYQYDPGFSSKAAAFRVEEADGTAAWLESLKVGRDTMVGDSGSPWLRVNQDGNVTVVGAHSAGLSGAAVPAGTCLADGRCFSSETSWAGLFGRAQTRQLILNFAKQYKVEICGVNRECAPVALPVSMKDLVP